MCGTLLLAARPVAAAHWPEHDCLADAASDTDRPATPFPDELWAGAQELIGHTVTRPAPRLVVADWLDGHGVYDGQHLGGCFTPAVWALQIVPRIMQGPMPDLVIIHELAHAVMTDMGIAGPEQHCLMERMHFTSHAARWLYAHGYRVNTMVVGHEVIREDMTHDYCVSKAATNG